MIWFTSDTHYGHKNICRGSSSWKDKSGCRDFDTLEDMNKELAFQIWDNLKDGDVLYHLGDWSFGGKDNIWIFRDLIEADIEIHLILGNHDPHIRDNNTYTRPYDKNQRPALLKNLFASVQNYKELTLSSAEGDRYNFVLCHYPMRVWNNCSKGTIMLHGHCHGNLGAYVDVDGTKPYKSMDVGVDPMFELFGQYRPISLTEVLYIMEKRKVLNDIDHHKGKESNHPYYSRLYITIYIIYLIILSQ